MRENTARQETLRKLQADWMRPLRVVEELDTGAVFASSPVEIKNGYVASDRENGDLFLMLVFRSVSKRPIAALDIRMVFYDENHPVPFRKEDFRYGWETATLGERVLNGQTRRERKRRKAQEIVYGEEFGQGVMLPLPESYFHRMQIELVRVAYGDGCVEPLGLIAGGRVKRFEDMDSGMRASYAQVNIFEKAENAHPIRVLPQAGENAWLCCCGHKNLAAVRYCEACKREKDWQLKTLSEEHLREVRREMDAEEHDLLKSGKKRVLHDKSAYARRSHYDSMEDQVHRAEQVKQAKWRLYVQGATDATRKTAKVLLMLFLLGLFVGFVYLLKELIFSAHRQGFFGGWESVKKLLEKDSARIWAFFKEM